MKNSVIQSNFGNVSFVYAMKFVHHLHICPFIVAFYDTFLFVDMSMIRSQVLFRVYLTANLMFSFATSELATGPRKFLHITFAS